MGYPVFPCVPGQKAPLTQHGFHDATTDVGRIEAWWRKHPQANIAIPTPGLQLITAADLKKYWRSDHYGKLSNNILSRPAIVVDIQDP